nr:transporter substrate-binding domain-containing protein [uncultured Cohaesibacter sp.]
MNKTILSFVAAATIGLGFASVAQADLLSDIKAKGEIVAATEMHYAPFDLLKDGEYVGIDRDLFDEIAKDLGVKAKYLDLPWNSILPGLEAGKFDFVVAPVTITAERMKRYNFTLPIGNATVALAKKAGDTSISKPEDISGKVVGTQKGTAQLEQLKAFSESLATPAEIREYTNVDEALADMAAGRISGVANSLPLMGYAAVQRPGLFELVMPPFGDPKFFGWVATGDENSKSLIEAINASLLKMHEDGRLKAINEKWLGSNPDLPTTMPDVK